MNLGMENFLSLYNKSVNFFNFLKVEVRIIYQWNWLKITGTSIVEFFIRIAYKIVHVLLNLLNESEWKFLKYIAFFQHI